MRRTSEEPGKSDYLISGLLAAIVWALYVLLIPVNRTENDDGYHYAWLLLHGDKAALFQSRFPLFLSAEKGLFTLLKWLGFAPDAYMLLVWVSSFFAAGAIFIFYLIVRKRFRLSRRSAVITVLMLAFSYGFWRYAVEAELYSISHFLIFLTFYLLTRPAGEDDLRPVLSAAAIGSLAVMVYKPNFIPLFLAFPWIFIANRQWKRAACYLAAGAAGILGIYALIYVSVPVTEHSYISYLFSGSDGNSGNPLMSIFVYLSDIASSNYLYGFSYLTTLIHARFPANMIVEEVLTASFYPALNYAAVATSACLLLTALFIVYRKVTLTPLRSVGNAQQRLQLVMWLWLIVYWLVLAVLDPDSPEPWMMLVPPLFFLTGTGLVQRFEGADKPGFYAVYLLLVLLIVHNLVAAVIPNLNSRSDYNKNKTEHIIALATTDDVIICFGSYTEFYYLQYYSHGRVLDANESLQNLPAVLAASRLKKSTVFLTDDVIHPEDVMKFRNPKNLSVLKTMIRTHRVSLHQQGTSTGNFSYYTMSN